MSAKLSSGPVAVRRHMLSAVAFFTIAAALASCGGDDGPAKPTIQRPPLPEVTDPAPDVVVAVWPRCEYWSIAKSVVYVALEGDSARDCASPPEGTLVLNYRQEVTIRTPGGLTYKVNVPKSQAVEKGAIWGRYETAPTPDAATPTPQP